MHVAAWPPIHIIIISYVYKQAVLLINRSADQQPVNIK